MERRFQCYLFCCREEHQPQGYLPSTPPVQVCLPSHVSPPHTLPPSHPEAERLRQNCPSAPEMRLRLLWREACVRRCRVRRIRKELARAALTSSSPSRSLPHTLPLLCKRASLAVLAQQGATHVQLALRSQQMHSLRLASHPHSPTCALTMSSSTAAAAADAAHAISFHWRGKTHRLTRAAVCDWALLQ